MNHKHPCWKHNRTSDSYFVPIVQSSPQELEAMLQQFWADYAAMLSQRLDGASLGEVVIILDAITGLASLFASQSSSSTHHRCPKVYLYFPWLASLKAELSVPYFRKKEAMVDADPGHEMRMVSEVKESLDQLTKNMLRLEALSPLQNLAGNGILTIAVFYGNGEREPVHKIVLMNREPVYEI